MTSTALWRTTFLATLFALLTPALLSAAGLYKWVDKEGKVHYSSTPPSEQPRTETRLSVPSAPTDANAPEPQAERDASGNCQTVKCMADQMEADRLARERKYDERRAENERAARKPAPPTQPQVSSPLDRHLQENCRKGLFYGSRSTDCDNLAELQRQWQMHQLQNEAATNAARKRGEYR